MEHALNKEQLPVRRSPRTSMHAVPQAMTSDTTPAVLIVEDDPWVREITHDLLVDAGFVVASAPDGLAGFELAQRLSPDVIILDLVMPRVSGVEFLRRLRDDPRLCDIPVIVASGQARSVASSAALQVDAFVDKPLDIADLIAQVRRAAALHASKRPRRLRSGVLQWRG
jgi:CheY-like chemotaxis protein